MKFLRVSVCLCLALAFASAGERASLAGLTAQGKSKQKSGVVARYDATKDQTTVFVGPQMIKQESSYLRAGVESTALTVGFSHRGRTFAGHPPAVEFGILSESTTGYLFNRERRLSFQIDGEAFEVGEMKLVNARFYQLMGSKWREDLAVAVPYELFLKLAQSQKAELKVGSQKFSLRQEHLEPLRELARYVTTTGQSS